MSLLIYVECQILDLRKFLSQAHVQSFSDLIVESNSKANPLDRLTFFD